MNYITETVFFGLFVIVLIVTYPFIFTRKDDDDDL
jgi:hypothetical protein